MQTVVPPSPERSLHYDLTELFVASGAKLKYYGIARTVMEIGYELALLDPDIRFVVWSPGHRRFFRIHPRIGVESPTGLLDPGMPAGARPLRLRESFPHPNRLRDGLLSAVRPLLRQRNRRAWDRHAPTCALPIDMDGEILISLSRPKLLADMMVASEACGVRPELHVLLHDMIPLHEGKRPLGAGMSAAEETAALPRFARSFLHDNREVLRRTHHVLTNSKATAADLQAFAAAGVLALPPRVTPVPLGHEMRGGDQVVDIALPEPGYLLSVGILLGRKNLECVLDALLLLHAAGRDVPRYVIAGAARKRVTDYVAQPRFAAIADRISFAQSPNQEELSALYRRALAVVIPSRMEGWGLPLGEGLWSGTPGIAADVPALREVGGDLALYHDPDDPQALADHIDRLAGDTAFREALRARIAEARLHLRTWRDIAADMLAAVSLLRAG